MATKPAAADHWREEPALELAAAAVLEPLPVVETETVAAEGVAVVDRDIVAFLTDPDDIMDIEMVPTGVGLLSDLLLPLDFVMEDGQDMVERGLPIGEVVVKVVHDDIADITMVMSPLLVLTLLAEVEPSVARTAVTAVKMRVVEYFILRECCLDF